MNRSNIGSTVGGGVQNLGITASAMSGINRAFQINEFYKQKGQRQLARAEQSLVNNDKLDIDRIMSGGEDMDARGISIENNSPQMPYLKTKIEQDLNIAKKSYGALRDIYKEMSKEISLDDFVSAIKDM
jgi:hypothetical protein